MREEESHNVIYFNPYKTTIEEKDDIEIKVEEYTEKELDSAAIYSFILRKSKTDHGKDVITIKTPNGILNIRIEKKDDYYHYNNYKNKSIIKLIQYKLLDRYGNITPVNLITNKQAKYLKYKQKYLNLKKLLK